MYRPFKSVSVGTMLCFFLSAPVLISGTYSEKAATGLPTADAAAPAPASVKSTENLLYDAGLGLYSELHLKSQGLSLQAFESAWKGYNQMKKKGMLSNEEVLSICDFSQSSRRKRLYIIDVVKRKLVLRTYVAHGRNSGGEYARSFSNSPESHMSSLGFYVTSKTYYGEHGLSLRLRGLEKGINDKADARQIVVHGSEYVGQGYLRHNRYSGRSYGCPAVPERETGKIIHTIKGGSCLFIYHPSTHYLKKSRLLNG